MNLRKVELGTDPLRWQKRAKEMARKEKNDEKSKRRQGKILTSPAEEKPEAVEEET